MTFYNIIKKVADNRFDDPIKNTNFFNNYFSQKHFISFDNNDSIDSHIINRKRQRDSSPKTELSLSDRIILYTIELYKTKTDYSNIVITKDIFRDYIVNNYFLTEPQKNGFIEIYCNAMKTFKILNRFVCVCRQKKALHYKIDCDLFLNSLDDLQDNILTNLYIEKTNTFYKFRISDLIGVIENALTHSPDVFIEPYFPRNPYTNCQFTKAELYNIYFCVKDSTFIMSQLFHNFFLVHFDLVKFKIMNDDILRDVAVTNYSFHMCDQELMVEFENMEETCKRHMPKISSEFNRLDVAKRLKPQVILFVRYCYTNSKVKRFHYLNQVTKELKKIKKENPFFEKNTILTRKIRRPASRINQSQMVNGIFTFGHNPENEVLESESSISTDETDQNGNTSVTPVSGTDSTTSSASEDLTFPTTIREQVDRFLQDNPGATVEDYYNSLPTDDILNELTYSFRDPEGANVQPYYPSEDVDLDVDMDVADDELTEEQRQQRLSNFRELVSTEGESDSSDTDSDEESDSDGYLESDSDDGITVTV